MKLEWRKCPCGSPVCKREYPTNLGTFCEGTGFDPEEKILMNRAFAALILFEGVQTDNKEQRL